MRNGFIVGGVMPPHPPPGVLPPPGPPPGVLPPPGPPPGQHPSPSSHQCIVSVLERFVAYMLAKSAHV